MGNVVCGALRVEHEVGEHLGEQPEGSFDVRLVLRPLCRRANANRAIERSVDLRRVL